MLKNFFKNYIFTFSVLAVILFAASLAIYFKFALFHLDKFETADEHLWITGETLLMKNGVEENSVGRIQKYWIAAAEENWKKTRINDKPGVSLAYVSGLGYLFSKDPGNHLVKQGKWSATYDPQVSQKMLFNFRFPLVIFTGLIGIFFFIYLWRLTSNKWLALVASSSILLSPILIGISQIINPDTLLWPFSFASILAFFVFARRGRFVDALLAGIFFGFALLSKYVALILIPFYLAIALSVLFFEYEKLEKEGVLIKRMRQVFIGYPLVIALGIGLFALLMPALIIDKNLLYKSTLGFGSLGKKLEYLYYPEIFFLLDAFLIKGFLTRFLMKKLRFLRLILPRLLYLALSSVSILILINYIFKDNVLGITDTVFGPQENFVQLLKEGIIPQINPLLFSLPPVILFLTLFLWLKSIIRRSSLDFVVFPLSAFIVIYYFAMYMQKVILNPRYSISLYPIVITLAGIGFYELIKLLYLKKQNLLVSALASLIIFLSANEAEKIRPFYFNYTTDLLPKNYSFTKAWGYGGYETAKFITAGRENPKDLTIWADYYGVCYFFEGNCLFQNSPRWAKKEILNKLDYYVLTSQGQIKNRPSTRALEEKYPNSQLISEIKIGNRSDNYIRVYKIIHPGQSKLADPEPLLRMNIPTRCESFPLKKPKNPEKNHCSIESEI